MKINFHLFNLIKALLVYKPAGINKHFSVALVAEKLSEQLGKPVYASAIWKKLESLYNLSAVEDREEAIPFSLQVQDKFKTNELFHQLDTG